MSLETVRSEVEKQVDRGPGQVMIGGIPFTPRVKKVLQLAAKEAKNLNHTYVGTEHVLLGLLLEGNRCGRACVEESKRGHRPNPAGNLEGTPSKL